MNAGSPVRVRRVWSRLRERVLWMWECTAESCPRARGYHHNQRQKDRILARMGKPPDTPPFDRAVAGAIRHWHRFHDPTGPCQCCDHHLPKVLEGK